MKKEVKACASYTSLNKVDTDWFNRNDVKVNPNTHWSAHHLHFELPLAGAEFVYDCRLQPHPGERGDGFSLGPFTICCRTSLDLSMLKETQRSYKFLLTT